MDDTRGKKLSAAVDRLLEAYPLIAGDSDMPLDGRTGYLVAVVRVDERITGLDYLPNGDLFKHIRARLVEKDEAREPTRL